MINLAKVMVLVVGIALLGGCSASQQAREMDLKGALLVNPDILKKGGEGQALYRYENPKADFKKYTKVIIDPVILMKATELDGENRENMQKLADNAYLYLKEDLKTQLEIVTTYGPDTLRLQTAVIDADPSKPVRNLLSSVVPIGMAVSIAKYAVTGKPLGVGEISVEVRVTDAATGELLIAAVDKRVGGKALGGVWDSWYNADDSLKYWAKKATYFICEKHGDKKCVAP